MITRNRVGLRAVEKEDLQILKDWRNIPSFRKNFREFRELNNSNQDDWFLHLSGSSNDFMFIIDDIDKNISVGAGGLLYTNWIIRSADFSFYIGHEESYIDDNYSYDAAYLLIDYGFNVLNLNKLWMELYEYDHEKINFFTNNFNFKIDGKLRENCYYGGRYWDSLIISLTLNDFRGL